MGTASLKHIVNKTCEFTICLHPDAIGKGYAKWAMHEVLCYAFKILKVKSVYWCVAQENKRAIKFYEKNGYHRADPKNININFNYSTEEINKYLWYAVDKRE